MGCIWSVVNMCRICFGCGGSSSQETELQQSEQVMLMPRLWMENDALYDAVTTIKDKLQDKDSWKILCTISKFFPCQVKSCICKGGSFKGAMRDSYGWKNNICVKFGCNHLQTDHMSNLSSASTTEFISVTTLVFDIINIKITLTIESKKPKHDRNLILEHILKLIQGEITNCIRLQTYMSFNIDRLYGPPPFEETSIEQILLNFCMHAFGNDTKKLKLYFIITKFVLRYYDTWIWHTKEMPIFNPNRYSKSYQYYYQRYMVYCYLPRCIHSISHRYKISMIFGQDVLRYTLHMFRAKLQIWCYKESIFWSSLTKFYCLDYLPIYLDMLEQQVYAEESPIWHIHYTLSDFKTKLDNVGMNYLTEESNV